MENKKIVAQEHREAVREEQQKSKRINKRGYLLEEFRLFHLKDAKGTTMEFHYHEFCKVVMLVSGQGGYTVEDQHYALQAGDILLIGSGQVHRPEFVWGAEYERIIIYISPEFLQKQSTRECNLEELFDGTQGHVLRLEERKYKRLFERAGELEEELAEQSYGSSVMANSILLQLLVKLGRNRAKGRIQQAERPVVSDERIERMLKYLEEHLAEHLTMEQLAEQFFISKYHMMRLFKKETGVSIYEYLTERRLVFARELIRQGISATESCFMAGFGTYSSFTRAYGKRFGTTPTGRNGRCISMDEA